MIELSNCPGLSGDNIYKRINDFLLLVGHEREPRNLFRRFIREIIHLVPFDISVIHFLNSKMAIYESEALGVPTKKVDDYREYYSQIDCLKQKTLPDTRVLSANWRFYQNTEYVTDFLYPLGIKHSAVIIIHDWRGRPRAAVSLNREGNKEFGKQDLAILSIIQSHIENLYANLTINTSLTGENLHDCEWLIKHRGLTGREAEVAVLLCRRLKIAEIGVILDISPRTVQKHIENIYAKLKVLNRDEFLNKLLHELPFDSLSSKPLLEF